MRIITILLILTAGLPAMAEVKLPTFFADSMVLQREAKVPVWGWATPGEKVTASLAEQRKETTADSKGNWRIDLDPMRAGGPFELVVQGENKLICRDVLIGEVWICSGQSNMEFRMFRTSQAEADMKSADYPQIRLFDGNTRQGSMFRQQDLPGKKWVPCKPRSVASFSAVGYFFGQKIHRELKVPVGLISINWGGTPIEAWTGEYGFAAVPELKDIFRQIQGNIGGTPENQKLSEEAIRHIEEWLDSARQAVGDKKHLPELPPLPEGLRYRSEKQPTVLFNSLAAPLAPMAIRGLLWYQGEANVKDGSLYQYKMKALAASWRKEFDYPTMPIYFAQLAPYTYADPDHLPVVWEAQQAFADQDDNAKMAVINDIGDIRDIHPKNKKDVGNRLALLALKYEYGYKELMADSPRVESVRTDGDSVSITFSHAEKLKTTDGTAPRYFEVAGADGKFFPAQAVLRGNQAVVKCDRVAAPRSVRYAWNQLVTTNLVNENNLPVSAFRKTFE